MEGEWNGWRTALTQDPRLKRFRNLEIQEFPRAIHDLPYDDDDGGAGAV